MARIDALAAGLEKGGEQLLDRNDDGMLLVRLYLRNLYCNCLYDMSMLIHAYILHPLPLFISIAWDIHEELYGMGYC